MKKCILLLWLFLEVLFSNAQYSLIFCEKVGENGSPQGISNSFKSNGDSATIQFYLKSEEQLNTNNLDFVVYYINAEGNEENIMTLVQKTDSNWNYIWKEVVIFASGTYRVKVYNANGNYLTSANLSLKH